MGTEGMWLIHWLQVYIFNKPIVDKTPNLMYPFKNGYCPNISKTTEFKNYYHVRNFLKKIRFFYCCIVLLLDTRLKWSRKTNVFTATKERKRSGPEIIQLQCPLNHSFIPSSIAANVQRIYSCSLPQLFGCFLCLSGICLNYF